MICTPNARGRSGQDRWQGEYREDTNDRSHSSTQKQHHKNQQTQRGNGPRGIAQADHEERTTARVTDEDSERYGDGRGNAHRSHGIAEMLQQQVPDPVRALPISGIGEIAKEVHAGRFLNHGSVPRSMSKIRPSKISDRVSIKIN